MAKKLQLSIQTPCHENWDAMTPVEKGKFCGSCQKLVVDFSSMSDRQVAEFFKKPSTGSVCGRFMTDQLERDIEIPKKRIPWLKYFFQFVIPAFLVSIKVSANKTQGKIHVNTVTTDTIKRPMDVKVGMQAKPVCTKPLMGDTIVTPVESLKGEITNQVIDQEKVNDANITLRGNVSFRMGGVRTIGKNEGPLLVIDNIPMDLSFLSKLNPQTIDSVSILKSKEAITIYGPEGVNGILLIKTKKIKNVDSDLMKKEVPQSEEKKVNPGPTDDKSAASVKIFPNPVHSGSSLYIEIQQAEEGYYSIQLLSQSGQLFYQKDIWIDAEARVLNIDIPNVAAGTYFLLLGNKKKGNSFSEKLIIQ